MSDIKKLTNNETVIFYNNDLEQLLAQSAEECESLGILHLASYEKYNKLSNIINIPVIILSSGIGFITGIDLNYDKMNIILGIGSVFVGIIKSVDSYFQLGKRAESHRMCALQYTQINKKLQIELSLCREQRQTAKDMLSIIKTDIKNLQDISPVIDQEIIKEYNLKYGKYKNVKKPNFVNGLSSVKVNANSLEQEMASARSIPPSIHSGAPSRPMSVMGDNNNYGGGGGGGFGGSGGGGSGGGGSGGGSGGGGSGGYNPFANDFRGGGGGESNFPDLNTNFVNLNDVVVDIPFSNSQMNENTNRSGNISTNSHPNSRIRSPAHISNARHSAPASASAQLVFANANANANANTSIQTPVSSSPVSTLRLQEGYAIPESFSRLSTPQLLTSFRQPLHNEHNEDNERNENGNEISLVIDIPHDNDNFDNNNNDNSNSNIILNANRGGSPLESSPGGSQFGSM
jgi:uncharacterized membrane protein YgcG